MLPSDIIVTDGGRTLKLVYTDRREIKLDAEYLRVESPSAEVQGHNPSQKNIVGAKKNVTITGAEPVGNYAIRLIFSDGHSTGIFSWEHLVEMADNYTQSWAKYLENLEKKGLTRGG